jgi:hypothetical protein
VPVERIELPTFGLQNRCSTAELNRLTDRRDPRDRRPNKSCRVISLATSARKRAVKYQTCPSRARLRPFV